MPMRFAVRGCALLTALVVAGAGALTARGQDAATPYDPATAPPAAVLVSQREFVKLGKEGAHEKTEAASAEALAAAKAPMYYLGMSSITGAPRVVFFSGYDTMGEVESTYMDTMKIPGLAEKLDRINAEDGELLTSEGQAFWRYRKDLSSAGHVNLAEMRMAELVQIETRPGYDEDFEGVAKRVIAAREKMDPDYHAIIYEMAFGNQTGSTFLVILPMKSMAYLDKIHADAAAFREALGAEGMKSDKEAAKHGYLSNEAQLFAFSPRMSYVPESWVKTDPAFWRPKPRTAMKKKKAEAAK